MKPRAGRIALIFASNRLLGRFSSANSQNLFQRIRTQHRFLRFMISIRKFLLIFALIASFKAKHG
jgi:hypothetical protein